MICRIPFFIAAPLTTVDVDTADGADIQIEQRSSKELTHFRGQRVAAEGIGVCRHPGSCLMSTFFSALRCHPFCSSKARMHGLSPSLWWSNSSNSL